MRFVQRDSITGEVIGHFANEQPYAKEVLHEDDPDILAYQAKVAKLKNPPVAVHVAGTIRRSPYVRGLTRVLAARFGMTEEELLTLIMTAAETSERDRSVPADLV